MNASTVPVPAPGATPRDDRDTRLAWACLIASPVAFVLAFVAAEGLSSLLGYDGEGLPVWWVGALSLLVGLAIFSVPAVLAVWFWRRAHHHGDDRAKVPALVLVVLSAGFLLVNVLSGLLGLVVEGG